MNKKIAFFLDNLSSGQLAYDVLANIREYHAKGGDADIICFAENPSIPLFYPPPCPIMSVLELHDYDGIVVATDLASANKLANAIGPAKPRFFYVYSLEWMYMQGFSYENLSKIYRNPSLSLVAPNEEFKQIIQDAWNVSVPLVNPGLSVEGFLSYAKNKL